MEFIQDYGKNAIIYDDQHIDYKTLIKMSKSYGELLNIRKEERVILFLENRPELLYAFLGVWDIGATCVCLDATFTATDLVFYLKDSDSKCIFTSKTTKKTAEEALLLAGIDMPIYVVDEIKESFHEMDKTLKHPSPHDVALILYTSGTTGNPKGVMLTYDNILVNVEGLDTYKMYEMSDVILAILPMHHIFPLLGAGIIPLCKGSSIVFLKELSNTAIMNCLETNGITIILAVPRLYEMFHKGIMNKINSSKIGKMLFNMCEKIDNINFSKKIFKKVQEKFGGKIKFFVAGGSKLEKYLARDFLTLGIQVVEGYGMTETAPMMAFTPIDNVVPGCAGKILPGTEMMVAEDGELLARGRHVMKGYFRNSEATSKAIDSNGWMHTGDFGEIKNNSVYVTGRKKEMIVLSNGKNINPVEIEAFIMKKTNLIEEIGVIEHKNHLTAIIFPNFPAIKKEGINNITETLKWGVIDKYNTQAPNYRKILDIKIVQKDLPKTKLGKLRRFMLSDLLTKKINKKVDFVEPTFLEYKKLKTYLTSVKDTDILPMSHLELDLGLDSLDLVELLAFINMAFSLNANEDTLLDNPTVEELAIYIQKNAGKISNVELHWGDILSQKIDVTLPKSNIFGKILKVITWPILKFYIKTKTYGVENIPNKPCLFAGNHQSFMDGAIINSAFSNNLLNNTYYMAKIVHFKSPIMAAIGNNMNVLLIDINQNLSESLQTLAFALKAGKNVVIFPEGVRSRDGKLGEFKKTFAILAKELNVPIVPFIIDGAYESFPTGKKLPRPGHVTLTFEKPFETKKYGL